MSDTIPRLRLAEPGDPPIAPAHPALRPLARLDVEQARKFLMELDAVAASTSPLLAMFLLGRCAEHAQALLDVIDAAVAL
jgi:hypothetical protein